MQYIAPVDTFLGRALTDPATGLPNLPYFCLIRDWEERRARRRNTLVRVIRLDVNGGSEEARRALLWRLCQELRTSDLIASNGRDHFRILLTSPDAEEAKSIGDRVAQIAEPLNAMHPAADTPLELAAEVEPPLEHTAAKGPCDPCEEHEFILGDADRHPLARETGHDSN